MILVCGKQRQIQLRQGRRQLKFIGRVGIGQGHAAHTGLLRAFLSRGGIFDYKAVPCRRTQLPRGGKVHFRVGFALLDLRSVHHRILNRSFFLTPNAHIS